MEQIVCENCGQEYSASFDACPLCGHVNEDLGTNAPQVTAVQTAAGSTSQTRDAQRKRKSRSRDLNRIPTWLIAAICVVLGLAIIVGAIYIVSSLGLFRSDQPADTLAEAPAAADGTVVDPTVDPAGEIFTDPGSVQAVAPLPDETEPVLPDSETQDPAYVVEPDTQLSQPADSDTPTASTGTEAGQTTETGAESQDSAGSVPTASVSCDSITLDRSDITLAFRGESFTFSPVVSPASAADSIVWKSSDETMVTVNQDGTLNARSGTGSSYVLITATCGDKSATCIVRCSFETAAELLSLSVEDVTFTYAGETVALGVLDDLTASETALITWSSTDTSVATVDQNGTMTAVGYGTAEIKATAGSRTGTCIARCYFGTSPATTDSVGGSSSVDYSLSYTDVTLFFAGDSFTLTVSGDNAPAHTWSTSDPSVCTVDAATGVVTAVGGGTANIVTTVDGHVLQCMVRVTITET